MFDSRIKSDSLTASVKCDRSHRDLTELPGGRLVLYRTWEQIRSAAVAELARADAAVITSYCPDAIAASDLVFESAVPVRAFYDLDTPVTLSRLKRGERVPYLPEGGLGDFDVVLSFTGGPQHATATHPSSLAPVAP